MMKEIYIVASLPRCGTTSIAKMAELCGKKSKHTPSLYFKQHIDNFEYDFYSDTPVFTPTSIEYLCNLKNINVKFIYIERNYKELFNSWESSELLEYYNNMIMNKLLISKTPNSEFDYETFYDVFNGNHLNINNFEYFFNKHKKMFFDKIEKYNKDFLIYNFKDGWEHFCDFLNVDIPDVDIPVLNKSKKNDKVAYIL